MTLSYSHNDSATAEDIVEYIAAHEEALKALRRQLPIACERQGHVWDNPRGILTRICVREGVWEDADPDCTPRDSDRGAVAGKSSRSMKKCSSGNAFAVERLNASHQSSLE